MSGFILDKATYYYYNLLSNNEKELYKRFLHAVLNMRNAIEISGSFTSNQIQKIARFLLNDRPDIFWYRGCNTMSLRGDVVVSVTPEYIYPRDQKERIVREMENSSFYSLVNSKMMDGKTDFEKALSLYEAIIQNTEYEKRAVTIGGDYYEYAYGIEGVILNHRAVCAGYAKAFQYFACKHNVWCTIVTGKTKRSRHAWNLINLYGNHYYLDATWGDPTFSDAQNKDPNYISYDYFCITTANLMESHQPILDDPMPVCTATKYNYYEYFGLVENNYSIESVARHIITAARKGQNEVAIKYSTQFAFQTAEDRLFRQSEIFEALKIAAGYAGNLRTNNVRYNVDNIVRKITIKFNAN